MDNIQSKKIGLIKWFGNKKTNGKYGFIVDIANIEYFFNNQCLSKKTTLDKSFSIEKDLGPFLNDLNIFIDRNSEYLKENNPSNLEMGLNLFL